MSVIAECMTPKRAPQDHDHSAGAGASLAGTIDRAKALIAPGDMQGRGKGLRLLIDAGNANLNDRAILAEVGSALCEVKAFDVAYHFLKQ